MVDHAILIGKQEYKALIAQLNKILAEPRAPRISDPMCGIQEITDLTITHNGTNPFAILNLIGDGNKSCPLCIRVPLTQHPSSIFAHKDFWLRVNAESGNRILKYCLNQVPRLVQLNNA